ncbi:hypothetical protein DFJ58DRAFT_858501 [Suillus subalutaceus]|uniref:uncharacterized protein n=1 Tax=Suillus subalutaceus TaxID=48586 RepID=UPI001B86CE85|nr:uncharacterized protein DFJ58DRAFT_858501 [Suillus subalutaceus]KAG1840057.1 hypothetical protein DFJ58DRAFT_858501 [Suillus subalutaceus]
MTTPSTDCKARSDCREHLRPKGSKVPVNVHSVEISQRKKHTFNNLDPSTCASLKLTVLNPTGRVWTMVAASIIYNDTIAAAGFAHELAKYDPPGIANFTNAVPTFKGIIQAFTSYNLNSVHTMPRSMSVIAVPTGKQVLKPSVYLTNPSASPSVSSAPIPISPKIMPIALGLKSTTSSTALTSIPAVAPGIPKISPAAPEPGASNVGTIHADGPTMLSSASIPADGTKGSRPTYRPFNEDTRSFIYARPSEFGSYDLPLWWTHIQKFYWGTRDTLLPVYTSLEEAVEKHPDVDLVINFASSRSVYSSTMECLGYESIKTIALIAESVPERQAREILWKAKEKGVFIIVPATVGEIKPGCFRIGNSGGVMDNIVAFKLYRPGSISYISNPEECPTNSTTFTASSQTAPTKLTSDEKCSSSGQVGGVEEYHVIEAVKSGKIKKPIVAWAIRTCASMFTTEVQFRHAGSMAHSDSGTAAAKNRATYEVGFIVPATFEEVPAVLKSTHEALVAQGVIIPTKEVELPVIPMHYKWALVR